MNKALFLRKPIFSLASSMAEKSDHPKYKLGAVLVKKNKIIATGANFYKTHPLCAKYNPFIYLHAEIHAILRAKGKTDGCDIYVYRCRRDGSPAIALPCPVCLKILADFHIRRAYYTISEEPFYACREIRTLS